MSLADYLASHPLAFVLCTLLLGLLVGSFLNVLVYRLPLMLQRDWQQQARDILALPAEPVGPAFNLLTPNSRCPHCGHAIRPWENIPLLSWLALRAGAQVARRPSARAIRWWSWPAGCSRHSWPGTSASAGPAPPCCC